MSIKHNPPAGTTIRRLVDKWHAHLDEPSWASKDPAIRALGESVFVSREPRPWKWPRHLFRQRVAIPHIENADGVSGVEALRSAPKTLDHYCDLLMEDMRRRAPAKSRNAPRRDNVQAVETIVLALLLCRFEHEKKLDANCVRVAKTLNIGRGVVRRIFDLRGHEVLCGPYKNELWSVLSATLDFIDANLPSASVRNPASASGLSANKSRAHARRERS